MQESLYESWKTNAPVSVTAMSYSCTWIILRFPKKSSLFICFVLGGKSHRSCKQWPVSILIYNAHAMHKDSMKPTLNYVDASETSIHAMPYILSSRLTIISVQAPGKQTNLLKAKSNDVQSGRRTLQLHQISCLRQVHGTLRCFCGIDLQVLFYRWRDVHESQKWCRRETRCTRADKTWALAGSWQRATVE